MKPEDFEKLLQADFSDEPQRVQAFQIPMVDDRESEPLPELDVPQRSTGTLAAPSEPSVDSAGLDDRRSRFEELLSKFKPEDKEFTTNQPGDMDAARAERDRLQRMALMMKGFDQINRAGARSAGAELDPMTDAADFYSQKAEQSVTDVVQDRKMSQEDEDRSRGKEKHELVMDKLSQDLEASKLNFFDKQATSDPSSPQSQMVQDYFLEMNQVMGRKVNPETVRQQPAQTLYKLSPWMQNVYSAKLKKELQEKQMEMQNARINQADKRLDLQQTEQKLRETGEKRRLSGFEKQFRSDLTKDPRWKDLAKQEQAFQQIPEIVAAAEDGNEVAVSSVGTRMARAMGEVGVLTDADVVRYLGNQSYGRKLLDWYSRGMKGQIPVETAEDIESVSEIMQNIVSTQVLPIYSEYAQTMVETHPEGIDKQRALTILGAPGFVSPEYDKLMKEAKVSQKDSLKESQSEAAAPKSEEGPLGKYTMRDKKVYKWNPDVGKYQLAPEGK